MDDPILQGETPEIDWPRVAFGPHKLVVRFSFYAQWLLSRRKVSITDLRTKMLSFDPTIVDITMEIFAAAVAENFTSVGKPAPEAEFWAVEISKYGGEQLFSACSKKVWEAVGKVKSANPAARAAEEAKPEAAAPLQ